MVFLSYAREDKESARKLYNDLIASGIDVWFDEEKLLPGSNWKVEIRKAIRDSSFFLALISSNSVSKIGYVQKELKFAFDILDEYPESGIFVIPVKLEDCEVKNERLSDLHWVEMYQSWGNGLKKIIDVINKEVHAIKEQSDQKIEVTPEYIITETKNAIKSNDEVTIREIIKNIEKDIEEKWFVAYEKIRGIPSNQNAYVLDEMETEIDKLSTFGLSIIEYNRNEYIKYILNFFQIFSDLSEKSEKNHISLRYSPVNIEMPFGFIYNPYYYWGALAVKNENIEIIGELLNHKIYFSKVQKSLSIFNEEKFFYRRPWKNAGKSFDYILECAVSRNYLFKFFKDRNELIHFLTLFDFFRGLFIIIKDIKSDSGHLIYYSNCLKHWDEKNTGCWLK